MRHLPPQLDQRFEAAMQLARADRVQEAALAFVALADQAPDHAQTRQMLGVLLQQLGRPAHALAELDTAAALAPHDATTATLRASVLLALGRFDEAALAARAALAIDPQRIDAHLHLGLALVSMQQWQDAEEPLAAVLKRQPQALSARRMLVRCRLSTGQPERALADALHPALLDATTTELATLAEFAAAGALPQRAALLRARAERHPQDHQAALALAAARCISSIAQARR